MKSKTKIANIVPIKRGKNASSIVFLGHFFAKFDFQKSGP